MFVKKYFPFISPVALQMLGLYMELWLFGAVTPARRSDDPRPRLRMTTLFSLGNFCEKKPIYCFPGPPDVMALQGAVWLSGDVTPGRGSGKSRENVAKQYFVGSSVSLKYLKIKDKCLFLSVILRGTLGLLLWWARSSKWSSVFS